MTATSLVRKCADLTITGLRTSLHLVDSRLPAGSKARTGVRSAIHLLDAVVPSGAGTRQRPKAERDRSRAAADTASHDTASHDTASHDTAEPVIDEREAIVEAVRERQPDVGELADPELDVADVQAQLQAKHALEERAEQQR